MNRGEIAIAIAQTNDIFKKWSYAHRWANRLDMLWHTSPEERATIKRLRGDEEKFANEYRCSMTDGDIVCWTSIFSSVVRGI